MLVAVSDGHAGRRTAVGGASAGVVLDGARTGKSGTDVEEVVRAGDNEATAAGGDGRRQGSTDYERTMSVRVT